jgi:hypothetical protein
MLPGVSLPICVGVWPYDGHNKSNIRTVQAAEEVRRPMTTTEEQWLPLGVEGNDAVTFIAPWIEIPEWFQ